MLSRSGLRFPKWKVKFPTELLDITEIKRIIQCVMIFLMSKDFGTKNCKRAALEACVKPGAIFPNVSIFSVTIAEFISSNNLLIEFGSFINNTVVIYLLSDIIMFSIDCR